MDGNNLSFIIISLCLFLHTLFYHHNKLINTHAQSIYYSYLLDNSIFYQSLTINYFLCLFEFFEFVVDHFILLSYVTQRVVFLDVFFG
jgi:hypothetical protein